LAYGKKDVEFALSKIDAAVEQLDWAIRLFLDHKAYVPAIGLAAAAEELLGKAVPGRSAFEALKAKFTSDFGFSEKQLNDDYLNKAKNWLKHWDGTLATAKIRLELDEEALQYIVRALTNLAIHDGSQPSEGPRFWEWMSKHRLDLL
jgi:hypothetical protein